MLPPHQRLQEVPVNTGPETPEPTERDLEIMEATQYFTGSQQDQPMFECRASTPTPDTYLISLAVCYRTCLWGQPEPKLTSCVVFPSLVLTSIREIKILVRQGVFCQIATSTKWYMYFFHWLYIYNIYAKKYYVLYKYISSLFWFWAQNRNDTCIPLNKISGKERNCLGSGQSRAIRATCGWATGGWEGCGATRGATFTTPLPKCSAFAAPPYPYPYCIWWF